MADKNSKLELLEMKLDMLIKKQHRLDSDIQFLDKLETCAPQVIVRMFKIRLLLRVARDRPFMF